MISRDRRTFVDGSGTQRLRVQLKRAIGKANSLPDSEAWRQRVLTLKAELKEAENNAAERT